MHRPSDEGYGLWFEVGRFGRLKLGLLFEGLELCCGVGRAGGGSGDGARSLRGSRCFASLTASADNYTEMKCCVV